MTRPILFIAFALAACGARAEVLCPDSIEVNQQAAAAADWIVAYTDPPLRLTGVTIYDGPPSQNRKVKPYSVKSTKGELRVSWRLPDYRAACASTPAGAGSIRIAGIFM